MQTLEERINKLEEDTDWIDAELSDGVTASSTGYGGTKGVQYRKIGNHIFVRGSISFTTPETSGTTMKLATLPYKPKYNTYTLCPLTSARIGRIFVSSDSNIYFEWVIQLSSGENVTSTNLSWFEVNLDYWID